ncbi:unnamed protein product [Paramecium sonneborni]|uniref:Uncharacterized protein n=1 Tax=Paramecium sonneborni TaxID=65129 RepID=A0A8S1QNV9_9CILI|nr:unnamed protein product [Paramecium sonneborni]
MKIKNKEKYIKLGNNCKNSFLIDQQNMINNSKWMINYY